MEYTIQDIIDAAVEQEPTKMQAAFDQLIGARIMDALEAKKQEIASNMFSGDQEVEAEADTDEVEVTVAADEESESETIETETEVENEDTETTQEDA